MQQYVVGGAVRDALLGLQPKDVDFVWVGATCRDMESRGFTQVGAGFPVFLDSRGQEHALARTERKIGVGYHGFDCVFDPTVTIEDDLERRDLTINSMAVRIEDWNYFLDHGDLSVIIDPYGGLNDLRDGILRHTSSAFAEDAVRVLRTARFAARYSRFVIDPLTIKLMTIVVNELNHVPQERIWTEFQKGLMEDAPYNMLIALHQCKAFDVDALRDYRCSGHHMLQKVTPDTPLYARAVWILGEFRDDAKKYQFHCIPNDIAAVSKAFHRHCGSLINYHTMDAQARLAVLMDLRALTDQTMLDRCIDIVQMTDQQHQRWWVEESLVMIDDDLRRLKTIDAESIAAACGGDGRRIKDELFQARTSAIAR